MAKNIYTFVRLTKLFSYDLQNDNMQYLQCLLSYHSCNYPPVFCQDLPVYLVKIPSI